MNDSDAIVSVCVCVWIRQATHSLLMRLFIATAMRLFFYYSQFLVILYLRDSRERIVITFCMFSKNKALSSGMNLKNLHKNINNI